MKTVNAVSKARVETSPVPSIEPAYLESLDETRCAGAGDELAQRQLFGELHATLYCMFESNLHIERVLQNTFAKAFHALRSYRGDALVGPRAGRVATRVAYRFLRHHKTTLVEQHARPRLSLVVSMKDKLHYREAGRWLPAILDALKAPPRIAFALSAKGGRSLNDVAEQTGVALAAARRKLYPARRQLEQVAQQDWALGGYLAQEEQ